MCVYACVCVCVHVCVCVCAHARACIRVYAYICACARACVCVYSCVRARVRVCLRACVRVCYSRFRVLATAKQAWLNTRCSKLSGHIARPDNSRGRTAPCPNADRRQPASQRTRQAGRLSAASSGVMSLLPPTKSRLSGEESRAVWAQRDSPQSLSARWALPGLGNEDPTSAGHKGPSGVRP